MLTTDQLDPFFPDLTDERSRPRSRWCTRGSRPTRSRRWPLAHPYRYIAHNGEINTVKGNRNWMRGPRGAAGSRPDPGRPRPAVPDLHAGRVATRRPSTRCSSCCTSAAASLPHAVLMMIPEAWENHAEMDAERAGVLRVPLHADGAVGRPGLRRLHRRHPDRRRARPQRPAPGALLGHRRRPGRAGLRGRRARHRPGDGRPQGPAAAGPDVPGRHRGAAGSSRTTRSRASSPPSTRTTSGCTPA